MAILLHLARGMAWLSLAYLTVIRSWQLRWGATTEEAEADLPGDKLVRHPMLEATRAVTIGAPPERIWPWIIQMGYGRAGFYAIDRFDNAGRPSADRILAEYQQLRVGDLMPTDPNGGFIVAELIPERALVLSIPQAEVLGASGQVSTSIVLHPITSDQTRLICRLRANFGENLPSRAYALLFEPGDFVMMRMMMLGIKTRAERLSAGAR